ncbi:MAG: tetratricopeptide repeat protein, partial [Eubacteriales bacterium]|nr:tetratricopeptide repeat protein [Eubacteriales bacterium]
GVIAGAACEEYFPEAKVPIPQKMQELLKKCLNAKEAERPHDFTEIEKRLLEIYREETEEEYPRPVSKAAADTADSLNNRALSFLDLGKPEEAERCWERALDIDFNHRETTYNQTLHLWRSTRINDLVAVQRVEMLSKKENVWENKYLLASIHLERADYDNAADLLKNAVAESNNDYHVEAAYHQAVSGNHGPLFAILNQAHLEWGISSISMSDNGLILISNNIGNLQLWNLKDRTLCKEIHIHCGSIICAAISRDGSLAVSGGVDNLLKLWDLESGTLINSLKGHNTEITAICLLSNGFAFSGDADGNILMWDVKSGAFMRTLSGNDKESKIESICCVPDEKRILSCGRDGAIRVWDTETGQCLKILQMDTKPVETVGVSLDGKYVLSGGYGDKVRLWDLRDYSLIKEFSIHIYSSNFSIQSLCLSPEGQYALLGCSDTMIRLLDITTGVCIRTFEGHKSHVSAIHMAKNGEILSGSEDTFVYMWRIPCFGFSATWALNRITSSSHQIENEERIKRAANELQKRLSLADVDGALKLFDQMESILGFSGSAKSFELNAMIGRYCRADGVRACWEERTFNHEEMVESVDISPDGQYAVAGDRSGKVKVWNLASGECAKELIINDDKDGCVYAVRFCADGKRIVSGHSVYGNILPAEYGRHITIRLWELESGQCIRTFKGHGREVTSLCLTKDGSRMYSAGGDEKIKIWDIRSGECAKTLEGHNSVCISNDEKNLISGSSRRYNPGIVTQTGALKLWDAGSGQCIRTFGRKSTGNVCFCDNGRLALSCRAGGGIDMWDTATGELLRSFVGGEDNISCISISPDGNYLLSGDFGGRVSLWDVRAGTRLQTIKACTEETAFKEISQVAFSSDGRSFVYSCYDKNVHFGHIEYVNRFPGWADWDEGARPYLEIFLTLHPAWTEANFGGLIAELKNRGYGWLRPEGVRAKLKEIAGKEEIPKKKKGLFSGR